MGSTSAQEPFAIVGYAFKLPQEAEDEAGFWEILETKRNVMTEWPPDRITVDGFSDNGARKPNMLYARGGHFLKQNPGAFDAPFFSTTATEAAAMDPQQRLALEASYHAFENAGIPVESIRGSDIAVFAATMTDDYTRLMFRDTDTMPRQGAVGTIRAALPNRVSWFYDLRGPSMHIDTACSGSLAALDIACQAMRNGDAKAALVLGANILLTPDWSFSMGNMNMLSPDSLCYSFDSRANGYSRGEGVVALLVKPLREALQAGDMIRAIIRSTASNQDGQTPTFTQPSPKAQEALIRHTYAKAGLGFGQTRYCEAHGTGTQTGDPIEMKAIGSVFQEYRSHEEPLYVGSVKANIGHLEGASGLAGVLKVIMALERGVIPPNALFQNLNKNIDADFLNLQIPTRNTPWPSPGLRRASVNSFGFGGANSHVILDDAYHYLLSQRLHGHHNCFEGGAKVNGTYKTATTNGHRSAPKLLVWSAADRDTIQHVSQAYKDYCVSEIDEDNSTKLDRLAYTLAERRSSLSWRSFAVVDATEAASGLLESRPVRSSREKLGIAWVFTGQGAQYPGMGLELMEHYQVFKDSLLKSDDFLAKLGCTWSLFDAVNNPDKINRPELSQPLCTIIQIALVDLIRTFGITPKAVIGHSSGEIAAGYAVGALCHESAVKVAYLRGVYAGKLVDMMANAGTPGAMMSVNLTPDQVPVYLEELGLKESQVRIACFNSPKNLTLSGQVEALELLKKRLDERGIFAHLVNTGVAYHSPAVHAVADDLLSAAMKSTLKPDYTHNRGAQKILMFSTVSGQKVDLTLVEEPRYWVTNLASPVRFVDAIQRMVSATDVTLSDLIEIGPHAVLKRPIQDSTPETMRYFSVLERRKSSMRTTLTLLGSLFCRGHPVSVLTVNGQKRNQASNGPPFLVDCPPYPFNHSKTYWHESRLSKCYRFRSSSSGYLIGRRAHDWNPLRPRWRNWLCTEMDPWLGHHKVSNTTVCPGTGMLTMALEAVKQMATGAIISGFRIKDAEFLAPIRVGETVQDAVETELELNQVIRTQGKDSAWSEIRIFEHYHDRTTQCFRGFVQVEYEDASSNPVSGGLEMRLEHENLSKHVSRAAGRCAKPVDSNAFYNFCEKQGLYYGDAFSQLRDIRWDGRNTSVARIDLTEARKHWDDADSPLAHPAVLDAAVHLVMAQVSNGLTGEMSTMIPQKLASMWISAKSWVQTTPVVHLSSDVQDQTSSTIDNTVYVLAENNSPLCAIEHLTMARVSRPKESEVNDKLLYSIIWKPQLSALSAGALQNVCEDMLSATLDDGGTQSNGENHYMLDKRLQVFLDLASHEIPSLRILEVGAGTGELTQTLLASLRKFERKTGHARFSEYVCTGTSTDCFEAIRLKFPECQTRTVLKTFDIHKDVAAEELASYDMVFIGQSLHSTPDLLTALKHLCEFLRPGGHLILSRLAAPDSSHVKVLAHAKKSPSAAKEDWNQLLRSTGFTGIELSLEDSSFVSRKNMSIPSHEAGQQPRFVLLIDPDSESQLCLAAKLGEEKRDQIKVVHLSDIGQENWAILSTDTVISLLEVGSPRLISLSEAEFEALKLLIKDSQRLLWVTTATSQDDTLSKALYAPATGLLRTVRSEDNSKHIVSLAIDSCHAGTEVRHLLDVLDSSFTAPQQNHRCPERELVVRNGNLTIPRVAHEIDLDNERMSRIVPQMRTEPLEAGPHLALKVGTSGMLDTLHYIEDTAHDAMDDLKPGEVEIQAVAWPISFRDVFIALGRLGNEGLGYECAGFVTRSSSPDLKPGDRVVMVLEGCMCTHPRAPAQNVIKVPDNIPLYDAVAAILPGLTAYHSLVNVARLRRGDTILVHSAAGATGQMAIGVARMLGAEIFVTVGFPDKKQFLIDRYGIPEDHIFYSRDTSFTSGIRRMTVGRGVDCVLNCLAGEAVRASFECLAPGGCLIEIGKADIRANSALAMSGFSMNRTYSGVDMLHLLNTDIALIRQLVQKILELVADGASGISGPKPLHSFPASDVERAFRYIQSGKNTGRTIVTVSPEDKVQKFLTHRSTWKFDSKASYIVGGGLGGIGRAIVRWMARKGARNLILLSRSGASSEAGCSLLSELEATYPDIQIYAPRCDVSSADDLYAILQSCSDTMPPIKGCINGIMNLKDSIFEKMTYSQWSATLASKVKASWNLHRFLPADMDFFILLSSLSGIYGAVGQSNYAAGCAFQDALARARTKAGCFGRCSVSLDLGWMRTIGVIAESELSAEYLRNRELSRDSSAVEAEDLIALLEHYCDPSLSPSAIRGQLLVGAITPADFLARGEDIVAATLLGNGHLFAGFDVPSAFANSSDSQSTKKEDSTAVLFKQAKDSPSRSTVVVNAIKAKLARAMGVAIDDVDTTKKLSDYGVDSLMAVELRNWIHKTFGAAITVFEMMGGLPITEVGQLIVSRAESSVAV